MGIPDPIITTERLVLRNWCSNDGDLFHEINSDPDVMEFFPWRRSREESDALLGKVIELIGRRGTGFYAVGLRGSEKPIGFCGISPTNMPGLFPDETLEIGWRLATRFQGNGYITEAACGLLDHAFTTLQTDEIVSFAVPGNVRSVAVMKRIGMLPDPRRDFDHPRVPATHPHLVRHVLYAIDRNRWRNIRHRMPGGNIKG